MPENILTVAQLTKQIKKNLESLFPSSLKVTGEISNWSRSSSGHTYFSLKDESALIKCAVWKSVQLKREFKDGEQVVLTGHISLYEPQGSYQIIVHSIEISGQGELYARFLKIKEKLEKEGIFDQNKKKPLPAYPLSIGIITSPTGSVIQDIANVLARRAPYVKKFLYPASVQGESASSQLIAGIDYFNSHRVDLIIIARGGGSIEDLWPFNSEELAYSIYNSKVPVISAVGHETDFTISDFAASLRAPTPSAAAEISVRDKREIKEFLDSSRKNMKDSVRKLSSDARKNFSSLKQTFYISALSPIARKRDNISNMQKEMDDIIFVRLKSMSDFLSQSSLTVQRYSPEKNIEKKSSFLRECRGTMKNRVENILTSVKNSVYSEKRMLEALNPLNVMQRGYALIYDKNNLIVADKAKLREGDDLKVFLRDGSFRSKVTSTKEE